MAATKGFTWDGGSLEMNLKQVLPKMEAAVVALTEYTADKIEARAKQDAPWTDRTGNARQGLFATTVHEPFKSHAIILGHSVDYGIWLEVRWSGRYAIIAPTIEAEGKVLMASLETVFSGVGAL